MGYGGSSVYIIRKSAKGRTHWREADIREYNMADSADVDLLAMFANAVDSDVLVVLQWREVLQCNASFSTNERIFTNINGIRTP